MFRRFIAASILKLVTKISLAKLTPVKIPLAGLGIVFLAMGLPVFPAAALEVTMTLSDGDSNNAGANWTATVCYDTANQFEFNETPLFIRYFPAKMRFILEPDLSNVGIGDGGTIVHEEVRVVFELTADGPNFTVTNDVLEGWDGQLDGKVVSNVILKMNSSEDTQYDSFDLNSAFDFNPISFPPPSPLPRLTFWVAPTIPIRTVAQLKDLMVRFTVLWRAKHVRSIWNPRPLKSKSTSNRAVIRTASTCAPPALCRSPS